MLRFSSHVFFFGNKLPNVWSSPVWGLAEFKLRLSLFRLLHCGIFAGFQVVFMVWIRVLMHKLTIDVAVLLLAARSIACQILLSAGVQTLMSMGDFVALSGAWALIPRPTTLSYNFDQVTSLLVSFSPALCFFLTRAWLTYSPCVTLALRGFFWSFAFSHWWHRASSVAPSCLIPMMAVLSLPRPRQRNCSCHENILKTWIFKDFFGIWGIELSRIV